MRLFIAEKPELARAIANGMDGKQEKFDGYIKIGNDIITWAFGHILELCEPEEYDEKYSKWNLADLPFEINDFKYKPKEKSKAQLKAIIKLINDNQITEIVNCGDYDEEGQILIDEIIIYSKTKKPVKRMLLQDITEAGIKKSLKDLRPNFDFKGMSDSGFARSQADWLVGLNLTRAYTIKARQQNAMSIKVLSVGRVQTPILGLIVSRDKEHESHQASYYYSVTANINAQGLNIPMRYKLSKDEKITDESVANDIKANTQGKNGLITKATHENKKEFAPLPYSLLILQAECSKKFGYKPDQVLKITQSLRENHKAISYNRSDCQYLNENTFQECPNILKAVANNLNLDISKCDTTIKHSAFNDEFVTAHTGIIPLANPNVKNLSKEELSIYTLICKRFVAPRLINPNFPDELVTKINAVVKNLVDIYNNTNTNDMKGTQLVFLDYGVPQTKSYNILNNATEKLSDSDIEEQTKILAKELGYVKQKLKVQKSEDAEINIIEAYYDEISDTYYKPFVNGISVEFSELNETTGISVAELSDGTTNQKIDLYADIYKKLVDHGIKPEEIAFIHDATTPSEKQKIFDNMNQGNIRILLGTYAKMGTGVNVQQKGVAMHEVTCPWRPSDIQQAEGRFIRTGNEFFEKDKKFKIKIYRYGTERTIDSLMWQANNVKVKTAREFTQGMNASSRTLTDAFSDLELSSDMMKAQATGNPFMITYALYKKYNKSVETFIDNYHTNLFRQKMQINDLESQLKLSNAIFDKFEKIDLLNISKSNIVVINTVDINNIKDYSFKGLSINLDDKKDPNYEERSRMIEELNRQAKNECQGKEIEILRYRDFSLTLIYENNAYIYNVKSEKFNTEFEQPYEFSKKLGEKSANALSFSQLRNSLNEFIANIEKNKEKCKINSIKTQVEIEALEKDSCEKILSKEDLEEIRTSFKADFRYIEDTFKNFKSGNTALELLKEYKPKAYAPLAKLGENSIEMLGVGIKELYRQIENMYNGKLLTEITKNDALIDVDVVTKQEISSIEAVQQKPKFSGREL